MEMEDEMGYKIDALNRPNEAEKRFYSDLTPVPDDTYGLTEKDYQEFVKRKHDKDSGKVAAGALPKAGQSEASIFILARHWDPSNISHRLLGALTTGLYSHIRTPSESTGSLWISAMDLDSICHFFSLRLKPFGSCRLRRYAWKQ